MWPWQHMLLYSIELHLEFVEFFLLMKTCSAMYVDAFSMVCIHFFRNIEIIIDKWSDPRTKSSIFLGIATWESLTQISLCSLISAPYSLQLVFSIVGRKMRSSDSTLHASPSCDFFAKGEICKS
jgi:hypothetical protein